MLRLLPTQLTSAPIKRGLVLLLLPVLMVACALPPSARTPTVRPMPTAAPTDTATPVAPPTAPPLPKAHETPTPYAATGELHVVVREDIKTLNPFATTSDPERLLVDLVYDTLLDRSPGSVAEGNLAQRWELYPDGHSLTFWLDPRARWHDGRSVMADDVVYSYNLARQAQLPGWAALSALVDRVEARSNSEVHFFLLSTQSDIIQEIGMGLPIVPARSWDSVPAPGQYDNWDNPVGSGPFRLSQRVPGERISLTSSGHHHRSARINTVVLDIVRNEEKALQLLKEGRVDLLGWDVSPSVANTIKRQPKTYPNVLIQSSPGAVVTSLIPNLRKAPFDDARFRRALAQAIDVQAIITKSLYGFAEPAAASLFPSASAWLGPLITPLFFDKAGAIDALGPLGYADRDGDGLRENPDGGKLQVSIACVDVAASVQIAQLVAADWKALGISTSVTRIPQDAMLPTLVNGHFDVVLHEVKLTSLQALFSSFQSSKGGINGGKVFGQNYAGYNSAECDEVLAKLWEEHDPVRLGQLYELLQARLADDLPQIPLFCPYVLNLYREDRFAGWATLPGLGLVTGSTITRLVTR